MSKLYYAAKHSEIVMNINLVHLSFHNIPIKRFNFIKTDLDYFIKSSSAEKPSIDSFATRLTQFISRLQDQAATMTLMKSLYS